MDHLNSRLKPIPRPRNAIPNKPSEHPKPTRPPPLPLPRPPPPPPRSWVMLPKFEPCQLKNKGSMIEDVQPPNRVEEPPKVTYDLRKLKRMKKDLVELNRKIRHSRKKHGNLIRRRNNLKKAIDEMMKFHFGSRFDGPKFEFQKVALAFGHACGSYRDDGKPKIDPDRFYELIERPN